MKESGRTMKGPTGSLCHPVSDRQGGCSFGQRGGFSLVEVLVGIVLFAALALVISRVLSSSGSQAAFTARSFSAMELASKVVGDLTELTRVHGTILPLFRWYPEFENESPVVDGQSPFFRFIADRRPPWGQISASVDGGLAAADKAEYAQYQPFRLQCLAVPLGDTADPSWKKHAAHLEVLVDWQEGREGTLRQFSLPLLLYNPTGPRPKDPSPISGEADVLLPDIRETLFPDLPGKTFDQAVQIRGCDRETALRGGKIALLMERLVATMAVSLNSIRSLERRRDLLWATPSPELARLQFMIGRQTETTASLLFFVLREVADELTSWEREFIPSRLDHLPMAPIGKSLALFRTQEQQLVPWIRRTQAAYQVLEQDGFLPWLPLRERDLVRAKVLESRRLLFSLRLEPPGAYEAFARASLARWQDRDPFLHLLYLQEVAFARDDRALLNEYPQLDQTVRTLRSLREAGVTAGRLAVRLAERATP